MTAADAHALADPLAQAYAKAWDEIASWEQRLRSDPRRESQRRRLEAARRGIEHDMGNLDDAAKEWLSNELPKVYLAGGIDALTGGRGFAWNQTHQGAAQRLANGLHTDLLQATSNVRQSTKELIRQVASDQQLRLALTGQQTAVSAGREMARVLRAKGVTALVYANGARHGLAEYAQMAIRTTSAQAYNLGTLNANPDVQLWEVFDGPNCGWTRHDDPQHANGMVVSRQQAEAQPTSHPNCRRSFGPRPDLGPAVQPVESASYSGRTFDSPAEAQQWVVETYGTKGFSRDERLALKQWQQADFRKISEFLRTGKTDVIVTGGMGKRETVTSLEQWKAGVSKPTGQGHLAGAAEVHVLEHMPGVFAKRQLPQDVVLWRGADFESLAKADVSSLIGSIVEDKSFIATSPSRDAVDAIAFDAFHAADGGNGIVYEIRARAGQHYATPEITAKTGYAEVVLPPGTRFRVLEVHDEVRHAAYDKGKGGFRPPAISAQPWQFKVRRIVVEVIGG